MWDAVTMKALIIEDDSNIRRVVIRILRRMFDDVDPWAAETVHEAIGYLCEATVDKPFDLIICDWDLLGTPKGGEVLEWIREHASQLERRFMFLSGNEAAQKLGVKYVEKPCDAVTLHAAIRAVCEQRS